MSSTTKIQSKTKTAALKTQKFVRLNLDPQLENFIAEYENKYRLLNRSDIIRMLLSEVQYSHKQQARQDLVKFVQKLPKPEVELTEAEIFAVLKENDLL